MAFKKSTLFAIELELPEVLIFLYLFIILSAVSIFASTKFLASNPPPPPPTPTAAPCSCYINGFPFIDSNNNGKFDSGESYYSTTPPIVFYLFDANGNFIASQTQNANQTQNPYWFSFNQLLANTKYTVRIGGVPNGYTLTGPSSYTLYTGNPCYTGGNADAKCTDSGSIAGLDFGLIPSGTFPSPTASPQFQSHSYGNTSSPTPPPGLTETQTPTATLPPAYPSATPIPGDYNGQVSPTPNPTPIIFSEYNGVTPTPLPQNGNNQYIPLPPENPQGGNNPTLPPQPYLPGTPNSTQQPQFLQQNVSPGLPTIQGNTNVSGIMKIELVGQPQTSVDLQLQPTTDIIGAFFIGHQNIDQIGGNVVLYWDSRNSPNGVYKLYAIYHKQNQSDVVIGPSLITLNNPHTPSVSQVGVNPNVNPQTIPVDSANVTKISKVNNVNVDNTIGISLSGTSLPNTIVTLLIYSTPIMATVRTDANGMWTYTLEKPLSAGAHTSYAIVTDSKGTKIRSEIASFVVASAFAESSNNESLVLESAQGNPVIIMYLTLTVGIILLSLLFLMVIYSLKKTRLRNV